MSILLNDNLDVAVTKPVDNRYGPWATTAAAIAGIPAHKRHLGLVVGVVTTGILTEYWFKDSFADGGLVQKTTGGVTSVGGVSPDGGGNVAISSVQISAWGGVVTSSLGATNGVATLDGTGKLTSSQLPTLTTTQLPTLTTAQISNFNLHTVTTAQVVGLDARTDLRIASATLTTNQISGLTSVPLSSTQFNALTLQTNQVAGLDARVDSRIASGSITTAQVAGLLGLVTSQISTASISSTQISAISSSQVTGLTAALATKLDTTGTITTAQVSGLDARVDVRIAGSTITTTQVSGFNAAADLRIAAQKGAVSGLASLDGTGKLTPTQIPDVSLVTYLGLVANQAAMLALSTGEPGDWLTRADLSTTWVLTSADRTQLSSWTQLSYPTAPVISVAGRTGAITLTKADVALGNVDNTADTNKTFTTAQITGFSAAAGAAAAVQTVAGRSGAVVLTTTDIGGISNLAVTTTQISGLTKAAVGLGNVDNVADANKTFTTAQITGLLGMTTSQIAAAAITTAQVLGLTSVPLSSTQFNALQLTTNQITGLSVIPLTSTQINGITGLTTSQISNFNQHTITTAQIISLDKASVGLANVDNTSDVNKPVSSATTTQLNLKAPIASPTFTGKVTTAASATSAGLNLPPGTAPTTLADGDVWTTTAGMFVRVAGVTVGPLAAGGGSGMTSLTGDVTGAGAGAVTTTLATVNANVGSFGSATAVPTYTVNNKGLITAAANTTISIPATAVSDSTATGRSLMTVASAQAGLNLLTATVVSGTYPRGNGTNVVMSTIQAADVPTLNQNTTGTAGGLTGTALTGDVTNSANAITVTRVNGTSFATLATGLLKNTTVTGVPSIAVANTDYVAPGGNIAAGTATTAAADNNSTLIATTAFIQGQKGTATPLINGTATAGTSARWTPIDHVHPVDTSRAPLASPTFTGKVITAASTASPGAGFNLPHGAAPTTPANGDIWTTTGGLFGFINSVTVQYAPLVSPSFTTPALGTPASGTLTNCTFPTLNQNTTGTAGGLTGTALTGDVTNSGNTVTVTKVNGTSFAVLGTGLLKNTTTTGVPSIAIANTDYVAPGGNIAAGTATTAAADNNSTLIATTAFIQGQKANTNPLMNNAVAIGTSTRWSPQDHVHPVDTSRAPLASPTFTGKVITAASTASPGAGLNLPPGTAPSAPADGDVWTTTLGMYVRVAGVTVGPLSAGGGGGAATSLAAFATMTSVKEVATVSGTGLATSITLNATTQAVYWSNAAATGNFVVNLTTTAGMDTTLAVNDSLTVQLITNNGTTGYYCTGVQIQGAAPAATNWLGGVAPTAGDPNSKNVYTFQIIKTAVATYTVFASQNRFA